jgi:hypothetical protein
VKPRQPAARSSATGPGRKGHDEARNLFPALERAAFGLPTAGERASIPHHPPDYPARLYLKFAFDVVRIYDFHTGTADLI